jgi:hypothetical protein
MFEVPVAIIIFRRPKLTELLLTSIAQVKPRKLFVIADGPRPDHPDDVAECAAARAVVDRVDWDGLSILPRVSFRMLGSGVTVRTASPNMI